MAYEKPRILDLSERPVKGTGEACVTGSGDEYCGVGMSPIGWCESGTGIP